MPKYEIRSGLGAQGGGNKSYGIFEAKTAAHALVAYHHANGYTKDDVWIPDENDTRVGFMHDAFCSGDGIIHFRDSEIAGIGDTGWWDVVLVEEEFEWWKPAKKKQSNDKPIEWWKPS